MIVLLVMIDMIEESEGTLALGQGLRSPSLMFVQEKSDLDVTTYCHINTVMRPMDDDAIIVNNNDEFFATTFPGLPLFLLSIGIALVRTA